MWFACCTVSLVCWHAFCAVALTKGIGSRFKKCVEERSFSTVFENSVNIHPHKCVEYRNVRYILKDFSMLSMEPSPDRCTIKGGTHAPPDCTATGDGLEQKDGSISGHLRRAFCMSMSNRYHSDAENRVVLLLGGISIKLHNLVETKQK